LGIKSASPIPACAAGAWGGGKGHGAFATTAPSGRDLRGETAVKA